MAGDLKRMAGRFAAILDVLSDEPISVRQLAREVGIPSSTAHDYLTALSANHRAQRTPHGWTQPSTEILFGDCPDHPDGSLNRGGTWPL